MNYHVDGYLLVASHIPDARHTVTRSVLKHHAPGRWLQVVVDHHDVFRALRNYE
jgi:hypothetical protein